MSCACSASAEPSRTGLRPFRSLRSGVARRLDGRGLETDGGFGLIELLMAMVILNVGILAIVASFNAGIVTLGRASKITTAAVLADQQMELYRAIKYDAIRLASATIPTAPPYTTDPAYNATQITSPACAGPPYADECNASRTPVTGADGKPYRIDSYIVETTPSGGRPVKLVTVVVRDGNDVGKVYVRQASSFDQSTG